MVLEGIDKHNNLLGSLLYPEGDAAVDLGNQLVSRGLAKVGLSSCKGGAVLPGPAWAAWHPAWRAGGRKSSGLKRHPSELTTCSRGP